jgi:GNAT superfamily N-acetyltransferase
VASQLFVVRRCDGFYRFWHDVNDPAPLREAHAVYERLTRGGTHRTTPDDVEYYDIFAADPLPGWKDAPAPLIRRLHRQDASAIEAHLLGLNIDDRRLRFLQEATDAAILTYVRGIDWSRSLLLGAIRADRVIGMADALFDPSALPHHAEITVSVDLQLRGRGLGRHLVGRAVDQAGMLGVRQASLAFLQENQPIQRIVHALGGLVDMQDLVGVIRTGDFTLAPDYSDERIAA